jgi:thiol:disulfide interchange protein DsbD
VILGIFLAIGVGLAAPFVAIACVPGWSRLVPRSGPWMQPLRRGLGVALLATAAWLVWIAGTTSGTADPRATGGAGERWEAWAPDRVATRLAAGDPVFVYFTADWCITCKVNERRVLDDPRVRESLDRLEVAAFRADWTRRDERIRRALERLGKSGVPAYVVYDPKRPHSPRTLSELLSVDELLAALRDAAHPGEDVSPVSPITVSTSRTSMDSDEATQTGGV